MIAPALDFQGAHAREVEQNFELNLAPIIDCLTVLITFMLASAAFVVINILDAGFAPESLVTSTNAQGSPEVTLTLRLQPDRTLVLTMAGKAVQALRIPAAAGDWDLRKLGAELERLKAGTKGEPDISLASDDLVEYQEVIKVMDQVRKTFPSVVLGGI